MARSRRRPITERINLFSEDFETRERQQLRLRKTLWSVLVVGSVLALATVPGLDLDADRTSVEWGETATLRWSSSRARVCEARWDGAPASIPRGGTAEVVIEATATYKLICRGLLGFWTEESVEVDVVARPPGEHLDLLEARLAGAGDPGSRARGIATIAALVREHPEELQARANALYARILRERAPSSGCGAVARGPRVELVPGSCDVIEADVQVALDALALRSAAHDDPTVPRDWLADLALVGARFPDGSRLGGIAFDRSVLWGATIGEASDLEGASFRRAELQGASLAGTRYWEPGGTVVHRTRFEEARFGTVQLVRGGRPVEGLGGPSRLPEADRVREWSLDCRTTCPDLPAFAPGPVHDPEPLRSVYACEAARGDRCGPGTGRAFPQRDVLFVTTTGDPAPRGCTAGRCSLREAVLAAGRGDGGEIRLPEGTYELGRGPDESDGVLAPDRGDLDLRGQLRIAGEVPCVTRAEVLGQQLTCPVRLGGRGASRILDVASGASLDLVDLAIERGRSPRSGGAIRVRSGASLRAERVIVSGSTAVRDGGAILADREATVEIVGSILTANRAERYDGGAIAATGASVRIDRSVLAGNSAGRTGGAIAISEGELRLSASELHGNEALSQNGGSGGAVANGWAPNPGARGSRRAPGTLVVTSGTRVQGNRARYGPDLVTLGPVSIDDSSSIALCDGC